MQDIERLTGFYLGIVLTHLPHGRLKVWIPSIWPEEWKEKPELLPACMQITPQFGGSNTGSGVFSYPNIGSTVLCGFANGDQNLPFTIGSFLGGQNAFGQYEWIKSPDEKISERHLITSKQSHFEMYENGKISAIVVDPDRRNASVDYDPDAHILSSTSHVVDRPEVYPVENEELSNIHSKLVLDIDGDTNGYSLINTHWLDLQNINDTSAQYIKNTNITTDIFHTMKNNGIAQQTMLSAGTFSEKNGQTGENITKKFTVKNESLTKIPNKTAFSNYIDLTENSLNQNLKTNKTLNLENSNIISEELSGKINLSTHTVLISNIIDGQTNSNTFNTLTCNNHILEDSSGIIEFSTEHNSVNNIINSSGTTNIIENGKTESIKNIKLGQQNISKYDITRTVNDQTIIINSDNTTNLNSSEETAGNLTHSNYKYVDLKNKLIIQSQLTSDFLNGKDSTGSNIKLSQFKTLNASEVINSEVVDSMDTNLSKIEKRVTNKLATSACENSILMDAGSGSMDIKLIDNVGGTKCTFRLEKNGVLTIFTDMQVNIVTNTTTLNSPGGVSIIGNTSIAGTLNVSSNITAGGVVKDSGCTLATHTHICPSHGANTSPGSG